MIINYQLQLQELINKIIFVISSNMNAYGSFYSFNLFFWIPIRAPNSKILTRNKQRYVLNMAWAVAIHNAMFTE